MKLKINGLMNDNKILWKKMSCTCKKGVVMESHPVKTCLHCKYTICEKSMPRESYKVNTQDKKGKPMVSEVKEITIVRGSHDDIVGWQAELT